MRLFAHKSDLPDTGKEARVNSIKQILVRLGIVSPFAINSVLITLPTAGDEESLLEALVDRRVVTIEQANRVREVQRKTREGNHVYEALARLEMLMDENKKCAQELSTVIADRKKLRRSRGEDTTFFTRQKKLGSVT